MIDLTFPIGTHFRWPVELQAHGDQTAGDVFRITTMAAPVHAFTHVDAARHIAADGQTIDQLDLARVVGWFEVLDLSEIPDNTPITAELLAKAAGARTGSRWLLKTCWPHRRSIDKREFWTEAPYVTEDAAIWLRNRGAQTVGFDFPQDVTIRLLLDGGPCPPLCDHVTHEHLLQHDITLIEYIANTAAISTDRIWLVAAPLLIRGADGAPVRILGWPDGPPAPSF